LPKAIEKALIKEYRNKGYSYNDARKIAFAIMVKKGLWKRK
jgi:hypothetical protein